MPRGRLVHDVERARHADRSQVPGPDVFDHAAMLLPGVVLRAHLADAIVLLDGVAHRQALRQVQRHRLLDVEILAGLAGGDGLERVPVRQGGDDHRVEVLVLEHLPVVAVSAAGGLEPFDGRFEPVLVHIASRGDDHVRMRGAVAQVDPAHVAAADQAEVNPAVRSGCWRRASDLPRRPDGARQSRWR